MPEIADQSFGAYLNEAYDVTQEKGRLHTNILEKGTVRSEGGVFLTILQADAEKFYGETKGYEVKTLNTYTHQITMKVTGPTETLKITFSEAPRNSATYEVEKLK